MSEDAKFPKILDDRMRAFFESAAEFIKRMKANGSDPCHAITPKDPAWMEWLDYFLRHVGSVPVTMRMVEEGRAERFTVPAKQPEWFDPRYVPPDRIPNLSAIQPRVDPGAERRMAKIRDSLEAWKKNPPPGGRLTGFRPASASIDRLRDEDAA